MNWTRPILKHQAINLQLILKHISNEDLVNLVDNAKMVVCPYRDATQSGVLMTAYACQTGVIASDVGSFPEFINPGENGMLSPVNNADELARVIINVLTTKDYMNWTSNLQKSNKENPWLVEKNNILSIYTINKIT